MRIVALIASIALLVAGSPAGAADPVPATEDQKTLYALGLIIGQSLTRFTLSEAELELVKAGLADGALSRPPKVDLSTFGPKVQALEKQRAAAVAAVEKKAGQSFLDKAAAEPGATRTPSGLVITALRPGTGESPKATDRVRVHYTGKLVDGSVFDSSIQRGQPTTFLLSGVIRCWTEGLQLMKVGGKSRLVCPAELGYGDRGAPPRIKPGATLDFEVELLEIVK